MSQVRWLKGSCPRELYAMLTATQSLRIRPRADEWELVLVAMPEKHGHAIEAVLGTTIDQTSAKALPYRQYGRGWVQRERPETA
jgi:hypothetical protein